MKAIILAAGRGSRMKSLTDEKPKCLVELNGKPLLNWQLEALSGAGIDDIAIVTGYKKEALYSYGLKEFHNPLWAETQMVSSLICAEEWLRDDDCIVSYSDIFYESSAISLLKNCNAEICITYDPDWEKLWKQRFDDPLSDAETFCLDDEGFLIDIGRKASSINEIQGQYMGLLKFRKIGAVNFLKMCKDIVPNQLVAMHMTHVLELMVNKHFRSVRALEYCGKWGEFDTERDLKVSLGGVN